MSRARVPRALILIAWFHRSITSAMVFAACEYMI